MTHDPHQPHTSHVPSPLPRDGVIRPQPVTPPPREPGVRLPDPASLVGSGLHLVSSDTGLLGHLRERLSTRLAEQIRAEERQGGPALTRQERQQQAREILRDAAEEYAATVLARGERVIDPEIEEAAIRQVVEEVFGMGALAPLLADPRVENININGHDQVFLRFADGHRQQAGPVAYSDEELLDLVRDLAARSGVEERRLDLGNPGVSFHLPGGERVFAVMGVTPRPSVAIRRHRYQHVTLAQLRQQGTLDAGLEALLAAMVRARKNILISGGTSMGKTTLLRALAAEIPSWERLITVEDTAELRLESDREAHPDVVAMQAREANIEGEGAVELAELVRWALRMSPDRVIVGEARGPEVIPMCNAMSQGNDGSMGTIHSSSSGGAFTKLAAYAAQGPEHLPLEATNLLIASAVHFVVHLDRPRDAEHQRVVSSIREVVGADGAQVISNEIFRPDATGRAQPGVPMRVETLNELRAAGFSPGLLEGQLS